MKMLVTGANGFIGKNLCKQLVEKEIKFNATVREKITGNNLKNYFINDVNGETQWSDALKDVDVVIHLAGLAHVTQRPNENYKNYKSVNVDGTKNLALQASAYGVKRFVYVSSIGVNGNFSEEPVNEKIQPNPQEHYALSKKEAEDELRKIASKTTLEVVIIRPPLVYGHGVKANFKKLMAISQLKVPLPFGAINNKRSLIFVDNLINFILLCTKHPKAANETFLISDDNDVSTTILIKTIAEAMRNNVLLLPIPSEIVKIFLYLLGKRVLYRKVFGSLYADISKAKVLLGWKPPYTLKQGIAETVREMN